MSKVKQEMCASSDELKVYLCEDGDHERKEEENLVEDKISLVNQVSHEWELFRNGLNIGLAYGILLPPLADQFIVNSPSRSHTVWPQPLHPFSSSLASNISAKISELTNGISATPNFFPSNSPLVPCAPIMTLDGQIQSPFHRNPHSLDNATGTPQPNSFLVPGAFSTENPMRLLPPSFCSPIKSNRHLLSSSSSYAVVSSTAPTTAAAPSSSSMPTSIGAPGSQQPPPPSLLHSLSDMPSQGAVIKREDACFSLPPPSTAAASPNTMNMLSQIPFFSSSSITSEESLRSYDGSVSGGELHPTSQSSVHGGGTGSNSTQSTHRSKPIIKKPLNAFMLYMKEQRSSIQNECTLKESAAINRHLGQKWHQLSKAEQQKYYDMAKTVKETHKRLYPQWSAKDNYAIRSNSRKRGHRFRAWLNCPGSSSSVVSHPPMQDSSSMGMMNPTNASSIGGGGGGGGGGKHMAKRLAQSGHSGIKKEAMACTMSGAGSGIGPDTHHHSSSNVNVTHTDNRSSVTNFPPTPADNVHSGSNKQQQHPQHILLPKKCRARFGIDQVELWCQPCRRKKKCVRFLSDDEESSQNFDLRDSRRRIRRKQPKEKFSHSGVGGGGNAGGLRPVPPGGNGNGTAATPAPSSHPSLMGGHNSADVLGINVSRAAAMTMYNHHPHPHHPHHSQPPALHHLHTHHHPPLPPPPPSSHQHHHQQQHHHHHLHPLSETAAMHRLGGNLTSGCPPSGTGTMSSTPDEEFNLFTMKEADPAECERPPSLSAEKEELIAETCPNNTDSSFSRFSMSSLLSLTSSCSHQHRPPSSGNYKSPENGQ